MLQVLENFPRVLIKKIFLSEGLGLLSNTKFLAALSSLADCWEQSNFSFGKNTTGLILHCELVNTGNILNKHNVQARELSV